MHMSDGTVKTILSIITPISRMSGKLENLTAWLIEIAHLPVQVIIVHDVQDELTGPELDSLISKLGNSQITLVHKYCGSPGLARNLGMSYVNADWICFWDSDDRPRVQEFLKMISNASEDDSDFCVGSYVEISPKGLKNHTFPNSINFNSAYLLRNPGIWRMGFNRNFIRDATFAESRMAEDQYFLCKLDLSSGKTHISDKVVYEYYTDFGNQLTKDRSALKDIPEVLKLLLKLSQSANSSEQKSFVLNVITRVSLTGIKKARLKTKIGIFSLFFKALKLEGGKISRITMEILKIKAGNFFLPVNSSSLQVKLYGGLGNQLFQFAAGLSIAGSRKLTLEIDFASSDGSLSEFILPSGTDIEFYDSRNKRFNLYLKLCNLNLRLSTHAAPNIKKRTIKFFSRGLLTLILCLRSRRLVKLLDPKGLGYTSLTSSAKHQYLLGYVQSYIWTENSEIFEQVKNIHLRNRNIQLNSLLAEMNSKEILAVHIRLGDYLANPRFGQLNQDYYQRAIKKGLDKKEYGCIWVFSNDMHKAKSLLKFLDKTSLEINWVDDSNLSAPDLMLLLSSCHGIVLANSSFGWWSARLSQNSANFISAPNPWFAELESPRLLTPRNWVHVDSLYGNTGM